MRDVASTHRPNRTSTEAVTAFDRKSAIRKSDITFSHLSVLPLPWACISRKSRVWTV